MRKSTTILLSIVGVFALALAAFISFNNVAEAETAVLEFEVSEDMNRFIFDEAPLFEDGLPAAGNAFITEGYIFVKGTIAANGGVNPDGTPVDPDSVIGRWICKGYLIGDAAHAADGAWVVTTQIYDFDDEIGKDMLVSEGYELAEIGVPIARAITGGTGEFAGASGVMEQTLLGFNASEGVNASFKVTIEQ